jgi:transposase
MMQIVTAVTTATVPTPPAAPGGSEPEFAALVAIDWADEKHQIVLLPAGSEQKESFTLEQKPEVLSDWIAQLHKRFGEGKIAVIVEQKRGALVYALMPHANLVLYPINPKMSAKIREAFYPSGAKDDPLDTGVMLDILRYHRDRLKAWIPDDPTTRQLQLLVESRRRLVADQVRLTNRLGHTLKSYFPQALELAGKDLGSPMASAFLQKWPTLEAAQTVKPHLLRKFYYGHGCRSEEKIQERCQLLAQAQPLTTDSAVIAAQSLLARSVACELAPLPALLQEYDRRIEELFAVQADYAVWDSFPGAGDALAPRLAAAWGTQRERFAESQAMASFSGIGPVKVASGKSCHVHMRHACPKFVRQSFHEYAGCSIRFCVWARCFYESQLESNKKHHAAVRALAFKWQRIMWRCWRDHTPYDDAKYVEALKRSDSALYARVMAAPAEAKSQNKEQVEEPVCASN